MDSNTLFRWFLIIVVSAVVHSLILFLVIGVPLPGMFSRVTDLEVLQFGPTHQIHAQTAPVPELKESEMPAPPVEKAVSQKAVHSKKPVSVIEPRPATAETADTKAKVIDVKFEDGAKAENKAVAESPKARQEDESDDSAAVADATKATDKTDGTTTAATKQPGDLKPVQDKVAGVQAADSDDDKDTDEATEAVSPEASPAAPTETEPASSIVDKSETPQDN